ncbi:MAG TPA: RdgB/HAM1 family non-canonical purine NTP pyrophosphatase [Anaerolineae bacterium]
MKTLIASNNAHKHQELREIFASLQALIEVVIPRAIGITIDPDETADTYAGNALLKARDFAQALNATASPQTLWVIADDSGLEVDALHGAPGILSSRYHKAAPAGDGCAALLNELASVPDHQRGARFRCAIVLIAPDGSEYMFEGVCEGRIGHEKRGQGGFGFDPVFIPDGDTRTLAEYAPDEKHRISHRGVAARKAVAFLAAHK